MDKSSERYSTDVMSTRQLVLKYRNMGWALSALGIPRAVVIWEVCLE